IFFMGQVVSMTLGQVVTNPSMPGSSTNSALPGPSTNPSMPGSSTNSVLPGPSTNPSMPGPSPNSALPGPSTNPSMPGPSPNSALPGPSTNPSMPGPSPNSAVPSTPSYASAITSSPLPSNAIGDTGPRKPARKQKSGPMKNKAAKRRKIMQESSSDDEECFCLVCVEPFSKSRPKETWVKCVKCNNWAHDACTSGQAIYVCQNCDSGDESY
uniref:Uncharacterized protein n=1 Tax=Cyprinus carpio TaxID=7962 RepID=A0A8C1PNS3_CYPCA